jgi:hypothetical protein
MDSVLSVSIGDDDASAEQLAAAAGNLREELLGLAVDDLVRRWTSRSAGRTVKIELDGDLLELSHASRDQQRKLVEDWLRRRAAGEGSDGSGNA